MFSGVDWWMGSTQKDMTVNKIQRHDMLNLVEEFSTISVDVILDGSLSATTGLHLDENFSIKYPKISQTTSKVNLKPKKYN